MAACGGVEQETSRPQVSRLRIARKRFIGSPWWIASGRATCFLADMTDAERLTRLEERYAHLQRHSTEQDKVMLQLSEELAKLRKGFAERLRAD